MAHPGPNPDGVAVDPSGNIIVTEFNNARVQIFDSQGTFLLKFGSYGSCDGCLIGPEAVAVDATGNIYVAEAYEGNNRIQVFAPGP